MGRSRERPARFTGRPAVPGRDGWVDAEFDFLVYNSVVEASVAAPCSPEPEQKRGTRDRGIVGVVEMWSEGTVPVPVAAMMAGSAWLRSHSMVSQSERWSSSLVSWNTRAAHKVGILTLAAMAIDFSVPVLGGQQRPICSS
ncbi:Uncharacterized protein Adt_45366 [Abeliophyllum distichum]|uniref:Uncharacterized protein n=1 Tax=Abeliophyllum distichum TaxID=126358 RepID=A0ABD1PDG7_9LAMI